MNNAQPILEQPTHNSTSLPPDSSAGPSLSFNLNTAQSSSSSNAFAVSDEASRTAAWRVQRARRLALIEDLVRNLDILVYAQLSALYYMDCSLVRLLLRLLPQWLFFTPKPIFLPLPTTARPYAMGLITPFTICFLLHILLSAPSAGEAVHGYLHGGLLIDFVGVEGPVSKWRLILGDIAVLGLQWILLGLVGEIARVKNESNEVRDGDDRTAQIETEEAEVEKHEHNTQGGKAEHPLDRLYGGQYLIAEVRIIEAMKKAWWRRNVPP